MRARAPRLNGSPSPPFWPPVPHVFFDGDDDASSTYSHTLTHSHTFSHTGYWLGGGGNKLIHPCSPVSLSHMLLLLLLLLLEEAFPFLAVVRISREGGGVLGRSSTRDEEEEEEEASRRGSASAGEDAAACPLTVLGPEDRSAPLPLDRERRYRSCVERPPGRQILTEPGRPHVA
jgi:hypothetical protein